MCVYMQSPIQFHALLILSTIYIYNLYCQWYNTMHPTMHIVTVADLGYSLSS